MKTKLLRKVRRNYRIRQNGIGDQWIEKRCLLGFFHKVKNFEYFPLCETSKYKKSDIITRLRMIINSDYEKYSLKYRTKIYKIKNVKTIWYNKIV